MDMPSLVVVVPCYNEARRLPGDAFLAFARQHRTVRFLFVNDGSTDRTADVLASLVREMPEQSGVLNLPDNHGKAEAVRRGVLHALKDGAKTDWIGYLDADLAVPLEELPYLFRFADLQANASKVRFLFGCRVARGGAKIRRRWFRYYISRVLATLRSKVLPMMIYDTQCGAKCFRRELTEPLFTQPFVSRWLFDIEVFLRLYQLGEREGFVAQDAICEVPLRVWTEMDGSRTRLSDLPMALHALWRISRHYGPAAEGKTPQKRINPS